MEDIASKATGVTRDTSAFFTLPKVEPELLIIGPGSAGVNAIRTMIEEIDPEENPKQKLMVIDTDAELLKEHFYRKEDLSDFYTTRLFKWFDSGQLKVMPIGLGLGAGGDPIEGAKVFKAAFESFEDFFKSAHAVIQVAGAGGGTGSGVTPVIAEKLNELNITNYSIISYPRFDDGGDKLAKARDTRSRLIELGPTTTVYNEMISDEDKKLHLSQIYRKIDQACLYPILRATRWLVQDVGDVQNRDLSDFNKYMRFGNHIYPGYYQAPEGLVGMEDALIGNPYLDKRIMKKVQRIMFLYKGFTFEEQMDVKKYVLSHVDKKILDGQFESKSGVREKGVKPEDRSVSFLAIAKEGPDETDGKEDSAKMFFSASVSASASQAVTEPASPLSLVEEEPVVDTKFTTPRDGDVKIKCYNGKETEEAWVSRELANRYGTLYSKQLTHADKKRIEDLLGEIEEYSGVALHPNGLPWSNKPLTNGALPSNHQPHSLLQ